MFQLKNDRLSEICPDKYAITIIKILLILHPVNPGSDNKRRRIFFSIPQEKVVHSFSLLC